MRYRYTFDVQSCSYLKSSMRFTHGGLTFEFVPTDHRFTRLIVETGSVNVQFQPAHSPPGLENLPVLRSAPEPLLPVVQREVRALRGALTLWGVLDIDVDQPAVEYLFDTEEEYSSVDALGHAFKRKARDQQPATMYTPDMLVRCALARDKFGDYEIPLEFFRRGEEDCYHERYIEAYINFFFIFEFLFGGGQYKSKQLERNFVNSVELVSAMAESRREAHQLAVSQQWNPAIAKKYCQLSDRQTVEELVRLRGFLSHQSFERRQNWNPGTQSNFEVDARFLFLTCQSLLAKICTDILFGEAAVNEFLSVPVFEQGNRQIRWTPMPPAQNVPRSR